MAPPKHLKYYLNNRILSLFVLLAFSFYTKASNIGVIESQGDNDSLIQNIAYNYQLFSNSKTKPDCVGTLSLSINIPTNANYLIFERTLRHDTISDISKIHFMGKSQYPASSSDLNIPNIYWNTYFRLCAILSDGTWKYSSIYSINEYINQSDLSSLMSASSIDEVGIDEVNLYIKNNYLYVDTPTPMSISVFDLYGRQLYDSNIQKASAIPIENIGSHFIIVRYKTSSISKTKKMLIQ